MPGPVRRAPVAESSGISTISVAERSGIFRRADGESVHGLQRLPCAKREGRRSALTSGAPVWKVIQPRSASVSWDGARCSGVVPSQSVRISAPAAGETGRGRRGTGKRFDPARAAQRLKRAAKGMGGLPGGSAKPPSRNCVSCVSPRTMVKNSTFVAAARAARACAPPRPRRAGGRGWPPPAHRPPPPRTARRSGRRQCGILVAALHMAMADRAVRTAAPSRA
jgi:hypothetical protein